MNKPDAPAKLVSIHIDGDDIPSYQELAATNQPMNQSDTLSQAVAHYLAGQRKRVKNDDKTCEKVIVPSGAPAPAPRRANPA